MMSGVRRRRRRRGWWLGLGLILAAVAVVSGRARAAWAEALRPVGAGPEQRFEVSAGESLAGVAERLEAAGLVRDARAVVLLARRAGIDRELKAGGYRLSPSEPPEALLRQLVAGRVATRKITIPEGLRLEEVAARVSAAGLGSAAEFLRLCRAEADGFGLEGLPEGATLEGYLFPETYLLPLDAGPRELVAAMVERFVAVWREVGAGGEPPHPRHETVVIASLVEREAKLDGERAKVAGVIENRLRRGQKLEFCSTVIYALGEPRERLLYRDLRVASPYNTYLHEGLPPGPICSPGRASLAAACRPAEHEYYFFVLGAGGKHIFSRTGAEHERARAAGAAARGG